MIGETVGLVSMCYTLVEIEQESRFALALFGALLVVILLVVSQVLHAMLTRFVTNPVSVLSSAMQKVREGKMGEQVERGSEDEIGEMATAFNEMSSRLRSTLTELQGSNESLEREIKERVRAEDRLSKINECFLEFGPDPKENISRLTALCGALQGATFAVYSRLVEGDFRTLSVWPPHPGFSLERMAELHLCREVLELGGDSVYYMRHLQQSPHAQDHPGALLPHLNTYLGKAVKCGSDYVGALCVFFEGDIDPDDEDKKLMGIVTAAVEVEEERLRVEEERHELEAQILQTQKLESLGVLAGGIAHDFNNLLMGILGNAEVALMGLPGTSPMASLLKSIEKAGMRAAELTNQMLAYSGKGKFFVERVSLNSLIAEMADLLQVSISKKIAIQFRFAEGLPLIEADATQIRQIAMNLITNASEAIGDGTGLITLTTGLTEMGGEDSDASCPGEAPSLGRYVYLEVSDTGSGMDQETRSKIFDPFFTTKFTGRGLGLAAVLGIVRSHQGSIHVRSEPGKGSVFSVYLPSVDHSPLPAVEEPPKIERYSGGGTILLVDDEEMVRVVAKMMLEDLGFRVLTATDGREGVDMLRQCPETIDAVLLDMTMPRMNGDEALKEMKAVSPDVKVIVMSGYDEMEAASMFRASELAGFLQKPFQMSALGEKLRGALHPCE